MEENCEQPRFLRYILIHKCNKFIFKFAKQLILTESESVLNLKDFNKHVHVQQARLLHIQRTDTRSYSEDLVALFPLLSII